jgi:hypothetical protein
MPNSVRVRAAKKMRDGRRSVKTPLGTARAGAAGRRGRILCIGSKIGRWLFSTATLPTR